MTDVVDIKTARKKASASATNKAKKNVSRKAVTDTARRGPRTARHTSRVLPPPSTAMGAFRPAPPGPGVVPGAVRMAMDDNAVANAAWAGNYYGFAFSEGLEFLGYPYLAELSQRPEYRRIVEVIATEMTRKWIRFHYTGDDDNAKTEAAKKSGNEKIRVIEEEFVRLGVQAAFKEVAEQDGFFGRAHLYLDIDDSSDDLPELIQPIGDGQDDRSKLKVKKDSLKRIKSVEAVWTYPTNYNSNDPLKEDWYKPTVWFVMGKQIHESRLLLFIGREVPDLLKPAYSFGGLSLTQMAKPYVDNWLETRQSVNDIISAFSTFVLKTQMSEQLQVGGEELNNRADVFNNLRNNRGLMMLDMELEDFQNVSAPLGSLDKLQAQAQEHMAAVSGIPLLKLLGIAPSGLNASTDGEIRSFYDWIAAYQRALFGPNLTKVLNFVQLSKFGKVDKSISYEFEPLWALDETAQATVDKTKAETAQIRIDSDIISPEEERTRLANDPDSPYDGLDPNDVPDLKEEEEEGLEPVGGRPNPVETGGAPGGAKDELGYDDATWEEGKHPRADNGQFGSGGGGAVASGAVKIKALPAEGSFNAAMAKIAKLPKAHKKQVHLAMHHLLGHSEATSGPETFHQAMKVLASKNGTEKKYFAHALNELLDAGHVSVPNVEQAGKNMSYAGLLHGVQSFEDVKKAIKAETELAAAKPVEEFPDLPKQMAGYNNVWNVDETVQALGFKYTGAKVGSSDKVEYKKGDSVLQMDPATGAWTLTSPGHMPKEGTTAEGISALINGGNWQALGVKNVGAGATVKNAGAGATVTKKPATLSPAAAEAKAAVEQAHAVLSKVAAVRPPATPDQESAIGHYKGSGYGPMNSALRKGKSTSHTEEMKEWLDKASLPEDIEVWRGLKGDYANILKSSLLEGSIFQDRGFVSTSTNSQFSSNWSGGGLLFKVRGKKGQKAAAIRPPGHGDGEYEVVFQAKTKFRVLSLDFDTGRGELEVID